MLVYFYLNELDVQAYIVAFMLCATMATMFIIRAETHYIDLLKKYINRDDEIIKSESDLYQPRVMKEGKRKQPSQLRLRDPNQKLEREHWEEWQKQFNHPALEDKYFRHPAFQPYSKVTNKKSKFSFSST